MLDGYCYSIRRCQTLFAHQHRRAGYVIIAAPTRIYPPFSPSDCGEPRSLGGGFPRTWTCLIRRTIGKYVCTTNIERGCRIRLPRASISLCSPSWISAPGVQTMVHGLAPFQLSTSGEAFADLLLFSGTGWVSLCPAFVLDLKGRVHVVCQRRQQHLDDDDDDSIAHQRRAVGSGDAPGTAHELMSFRVGDPCCPVPTTKVMIGLLP